MTRERWEKNDPDAPVRWASMTASPVRRFHAPMTENDLKHRVLELAYRNGWAVYHVPQATMRNGGGAGYPDLTLARDGEVLWIELKQERGSLTPQQASWVAILPAAHVIRPSDWWSGRVGELLA